jgi:hypothetical protein
VVSLSIIIVLQAIVVRLFPFSWMMNSQLTIGCQSPWFCLKYPLYGIHDHSSSPTSNSSEIITFPRLARTAYPTASSAVRQYIDRNCRDGGDPSPLLLLSCDTKQHHSTTPNPPW